MNNPGTAPGAASCDEKTEPKIDPAPNSNTEKDPDEWVSGDEPMTGAQASYLKTLSEECGELEAFAPDLTKAEASKRIDAVRANAVPDGTGNRDEPRFWEAEDKLEDFPDRRSPRIATPEAITSNDAQADRKCARSTIGGPARKRGSRPASA